MGRKDNMFLIIVGFVFSLLFVFQYTKIEDCNKTIIQECNDGKAHMDFDYSVLKTDTSEENGKIIIFDKDRNIVAIFSKEEIFKIRGELK